MPANSPAPSTAPKNTKYAIQTMIVALAFTLQLMAYFIADYKGLDPDKPRNLAKSVTVK